MAYAKICPECKEGSWSIRKRNRECPCCGRDLDNEKLYSSGDLSSNDDEE